jgi:hypothetical protein
MYERSSCSQVLPSRCWAYGAASRYVAPPIIKRTRRVNRLRRKCGAELLKDGDIYWHHESFHG